ncbi:MAG TPA: hypothetical protein VGQ19_10980 [Burkholderiales bacterium]|jgi:hypothetical protein|nr:hypothetical protein [Burkholderiales bacterium]
MQIHRTARKHGIADADLRHAVDHALYAGDLESEAPLRVLYIGPDRAGTLLEVVVIERDDGSELAIHAMNMRHRYRRLLKEVKVDE